jgi:predicted DNA-binding protein with PD1-like motif
MRFQQFDERYILRLASGEPVIETITAFLGEQGIAFASVSAAGAVQWVRLAYWNARTQQYQDREIAEQLEVVSFQGNASLKDRAPMLHIHGVFGREDFSVYGGHVKEARVHPTLEVWLRAESIPVRRAHDAATGLDLLDLPERSG